MSKPISELKTAQDFYDFYFEIPEEKWTVNYLHVGRACCALGHIGTGSMSSPPPQAFRLAKILHDLGAGEGAVYEIGLLNDGDHGLYEGATPKARILAMLQDAIAKGL